MSGTTLVEVSRILLLIILLSMSLKSTGAIPTSAPFIIQQIPDKSNDWEVPTYETVTNSSGNPVHDTTSHYDNNSKSVVCKNKTSVPDISGVSYFSDGRKLKSTFWFNKPILNPNINNATFVKLTAGKNSVFKKYAPIMKILSNSTYFGRSNIHINKTQVWIVKPKHETQNGREYQGFKTFKDPSGHSITEAFAWIILEKPTRGTYFFTFHTPTFANDTFFPSYNEIRSSLGYHTSTHKHFSLYNDTRQGIRLEYPENWKITIHIDDVTFSPPRWISMSFQNTINAFSFYESEPDYVNSMNWDEPDNWTRKLEAESPHEQKQMPNNTKLFEYPVRLNLENQGNSTVDLFLDLSSIGYPNPFTVLSTFTGIFQTAYNGTTVMCTQTDITNWVQLPPPKITLSLSPNSIRLLPGQEKSIELQVNSSTSLPTNVTLHSNTIQDLQTVISPTRLFLTPHEISSATVHVKASDYYIANSNGSMDKTLEIIGSASLPVNVTELTTSGAISLANRGNARIPLSPVFAAVAVENPKPALDQIRDAFHSSVVTASEMAGLLTTIITIVTSAGIVGSWLLTRRQEKGKNHKKGDSKFKSGSPL